MNMIKFVCESLCMEADDLVSFASTAPHRYKIYKIPKRSGDGTRTIAHPSKQLKFIQRLMLKELSKTLILHKSAFAYRKNISIKDNAEVHSNNKYLLKMDFKDFFPSINPSLLFNEFQKAGINWCDEDKKFISNIFFYKLRQNSPLRLSIGAPSSPLISNFIMFNFDSIIADSCNKIGINYSRYADDISFSTNVKDILFDIPNLVETTLKKEGYESIRINKDKTIFSSKAHNRHITGVTLGNDGTLSIGREKKRLLSAAIHHFSIGKEPTINISKLKGHLSFAFYIEPKFRLRMEKKYGSTTLDKLFKTSETTD